MSIQRYIAEDYYLRPNDGPVTADDLVKYDAHVAAVEAAERGHRYECRLSEEGHDVSLDGMRCIDCEAECICGYLNGLRKERQRSVLLIADAYGKGQRDMLAKCIAAVEGVSPRYWPYDSDDDVYYETVTVDDVLAALRALLDGE